MKKGDSYMDKLNVAVIFGGISFEHDISKISAANIIANMDDARYNILPIYINKKGEWLLYEGRINNFESFEFEKYGTKVFISPNRANKGLMRIALDKLRLIPIDVVFPVLHGQYGEDGAIQGLLELSGIPYVGCSVLTCALAMDKAFTKIVVDSLSIKQAPWLTFYKNRQEIDDIVKKVNSELKAPYFIKPANSGSSIGIYKAYSEEELKTAVASSFNYDKKIVVEQAIVGRELECAIIGNAGFSAASCVGEIIHEDEFYSYIAKYKNSESKTVIPADIPNEISEAIRSVSIKIFDNLDGRGLARIDFFLEDNTGDIVFNEINTMPGFTDISMYSLLMESSGTTTNKLIDKLIELAIDKE
jgi:D-alanine-D-alanine ligase